MYEETRDYGFDEPDKRQIWILNDGSRLELWIHRNYFHDNEDPEVIDYKIRFSLSQFPEGKSKGKQVMLFPEGKGEEECSDAVHALYESEFDEESTNGYRECEADSRNAIKYGY